MGTVNSLYDLSRGALLADEKALQSTSNNVANQNTDGYTRQVVHWQAGDTVSLSGAQAPTVTVTSVRDRVLEQRIQQATQAQGASAARADVLSQVEQVFSITGASDTEGSTAVGTALNGLFSSFTSLSAAPTDSATRQAVLSAASTLAGAFNAAASQLTDISKSVNSGLASSVSQVNGLTTAIAGLNQQISELAPNSDAGTLEDQRQSAIGQLSQLVGLDQIVTENNGISLTTAGGVSLVSGNTASQLSTVQTGSTTEVRDASGKDVSGALTGGSLGGLLTAQNVDLPAVSGSLDALAYRVATAVNGQNSAGVLSNGSAGGALFAVTATAAGAAAAISVSATDASAVAAAGAGEGASGTTNALALAALGTATDASGQTVAQQLASMLSAVGTQSASVSALNTTQSATVAQLTSTRDSESAVSLDDEAANLSIYQRSYDAAAKLFSIADSVMTTALNLGEATTVS